MTEETLSLGLRARPKPGKAAIESPRRHPAFEPVRADRIGAA